MDQSPYVIVPFNTKIEYGRREQVRLIGLEKILDKQADDDSQSNANEITYILLSY